MVHFDKQRRSLTPKGDRRDQAARTSRRRAQTRYISPAAKHVTEKEFSTILRKTQSEKLLRQREQKGEVTQEERQGLGKKARSFRSLGSMIKKQVSFRRSTKIEKDELLSPKSPIDMVIKVENKPITSKQGSSKRNQTDTIRSVSRSTDRNRRACRRDLLSSSRQWSSISLLDTQDDTLLVDCGGGRGKHTSRIKKPSTTSSSSGHRFSKLFEGIRKLNRSRITRSTNNVRVL